MRWKAQIEQMIQIPLNVHHRNAQLLNLKSHLKNKASHTDSCVCFWSLFRLSQTKVIYTAQTELQCCCLPCRKIPWRDVPDIVAQASSANNPPANMPSHEATASQSISQNKVKGNHEAQWKMTV